MTNLEISLYSFCIIYLIYMTAIWTMDDLFNKIIKVLLFLNTCVSVIVLTYYLKGECSLMGIPLLGATAIGLLFVFANGANRGATILKIFSFVTFLASIAFFCL